MKATPRAALLLVVFAACGKESLTSSFPRIEIVPVPAAGQSTLDGRLGLDLGEVLTSAQARFLIKNSGSEQLTVQDIRVASSQGGAFLVGDFTETVTASKDGEMVVSYVPSAPGAPAFAIIEVESDAGSDGNDVKEIELRGAGQVIDAGTPKLVACYGGDCYDVPEDCDTSGGGCVLPIFEFGNVPLSSTSTQQLRLENVPAAGCAPPVGVPECTAVCVLTFDADPAGLDVGIGVIAPDNGFHIDGNTTPPIYLGTTNLACVGQSGDVLRRQISVPVVFSAPDTEALDIPATLALESNHPGAPVITIPLVASARVPPVAVARLRTCDADNPLPSCTPGADEIAPLDWVYFDGRASYDPTDASPGALTEFDWRVVTDPPGSKPDDFQVEGIGTPLARMTAPLAGDYVMRLIVRNSLTMTSQVSETSDVPFKAIPESRIHVQLVWDTLTDQDLHVVYASSQDRLYASDDCHWNNCRPTCSPDDGCTPVRWFPEHDAFTESNPRLDIDNTVGLGPENTNIDRPAVGLYRVYVHYYGLVDPEDDLTEATVRLFIDGFPRAEFRRGLSRNNLWRIAEIEWMADDSAVIRPATSDGDGEGFVKQFDYQNYPTGYPFGGAF
jgi:hypothetical protein